MSVLQQVLSDARKLATRLRDHDSSADTLLTQAQTMFKQVESMKDYCEEMNQLNEVANNRPRGALIHSIRQENRYIRELQEENKELREALEEQQNVMELIMSKYREQVAKLLTHGPADNEGHNVSMQRKLGANIELVSEMVGVMRRAAQLEETQYNQNSQALSTLSTENKGLREMLNIALKSGSVETPLKTDVNTQTGCLDSPDHVEVSSRLDSPDDSEVGFPNTDANNTNTIKLNRNFNGKKNQVSVQDEDIAKDNLPDIDSTVNSSNS